jgi:hypothetical protein
MPTTRLPFLVGFALAALATSCAKPSDVSTNTSEPKVERGPQSGSLIVEHPQSATADPHKSLLVSGDAKPVSRRGDPPASPVSNPAAPAKPATGGVAKGASQAVGPQKIADKHETPWTPLFNGRTLAGWLPTQFGGEGEVEIKNGELILEVGEELTGVTINRPIPTSNYEVSLEAKRVAGSDFFCGLTFPVKKDPCSLIIGGWGGGVCGLSSIDGHDASENPTTSYRGFDNGRWYVIRLRVSDEKIEAWIDKEQIVDQDLKGRDISIRSEVEASKPFGIASYRTAAALRNIRLRALK